MFTNLLATTGRNSSGRGWVLYDARCGLCRRGARRLGGPVVRRGFRLAPLQRRWVKERLNLPPEQLMSQMWLLTTKGRLIGGADAYVYLSRYIWWAWPLALAGRSTRVMRQLRRVYGWVARNRACISGVCGLDASRIRPRRGKEILT